MTSSASSPSRTVADGSAGSGTAAAAVFALISWGSAYPVTRIALHDMPVIPLAAARYGLAAMIALGWLILKRPAFPHPRDWPRFLLCGAIGITLYNILFNTGEQTVSAGAASLIIASAPILATIIAVAFMGEALTGLGWLGSFVSFMGVAVIVLGGHESLAFGSGAVLVLGCAACGAIYTTAQRALVRRYGALNAIAYVLIIGAVLLAPWWPATIRAIGTASWTTRGCILELGIFPAALGYAAWGHVIAVRGAARTASLLYLLPPVTLVLAFVLTREIPTLGTLTGGAIVMAGVILTNRFGHPRALPPAMPSLDGTPCAALDADRRTMKD